MGTQVLRYERRGSGRVLLDYLLDYCEWSAVSEYEEQVERAKVCNDRGTPFYDLESGVDSFLFLD